MKIVGGQGRWQLVGYTLETEVKILDRPEQLARIFQAPVKPTKAEKAAKKAKRGGKKAASSQKKGKGDDKKGAPEKRSEPRKKDKNEQVLTFNMDFFFNGES